MSKKKKQFSFGDGTELNELFGKISLPIQLQIKDVDALQNNTLSSQNTTPKVVKPHILFKCRSKNSCSRANDTCVYRKASLQISACPSTVIHKLWNQLHELAELPLDVGLLLTLTATSSCLSQHAFCPAYFLSLPSFLEIVAMTSRKPPCAESCLHYSNQLSHSRGGHTIS